MKPGLQRSLSGVGMAPGTFNIFLRSLEWNRNGMAATVTRIGWDWNGMAAIVVLYCGFNSRISERSKSATWETRTFAWQIRVKLYKFHSPICSSAGLVKYFGS